MADVKWIKLSTDFFNDEKIMIIEAENIEDKDEILMIWFKLLILAGRDNNSGVLAMKNGKPYTDKMLAAIFHRDFRLVKKSIEVFLDYGMLEKDGETYILTNWNKYQSLDGYEKKKERDREYQRKRREAAKARVAELQGEQKKEEPKEEIKADKPEPKKKEENKELNEITKQVIEYLNSKAGTKYRPGTEVTKTLIHARMADGFTIEDFETVIDNKCAEWLKDDKMSKFLRPQTLFGTKFEAYLNEKQRSNTPTYTGLAPGTEHDLDSLF